MLGFPNPVNEVSARLVAVGVVLLTLTTLVTGQRWLVIPLAYGFVARVLTGPTLSPLGLFVTRVVTPALNVEERLVPGPPKRFAQGLGVTFSSSAAVLWLGFDNRGAASVAVGLLLAAATLEAVAGICLGCRLFALLMRVGVIPESVCEACSDLTLRRA